MSTNQQRKRHYTASAAIEAGVFFKINNATGKISACGLGEKADGVTAEAASADGDSIDCYVMGSSNVPVQFAAASTLDAGTLTSNAEGRAILATTSGHHINGQLWKKALGPSGGVYGKGLVDLVYTGLVP